MTSPYAQANAGTATTPWRQIGVRNFAANCTTGNTYSQISAAVDRVQVNAPGTP